MIKASYADKQLIVDILTASFYKNKSVNFVTKQDRNKARRIKALMDYSFEMCWHYGEIFISEDKKGTLLTLLPKKKSGARAIVLDIKLVFKTIGLTRVGKVLKRESMIKKNHPKDLIYLWYIGVMPGSQGKGIGSNLLDGLIQIAKSRSLPIYLETSTIENLPFYHKHGFETITNCQWNT